jgi:uncharacterized protein with PQ loop repeat
VIDAQQHGSSKAIPGPLMNRVLAVMSVVTMVMTIPQVWVIWVDQQVAGVSLLTWGTYLFSAMLWFWHGLRQRDKNIYLACLGWFVLDLGVIVGVLIND